MLSKAQRKFNEWAQQVRSTLETKDESALNVLPGQCRWLQYWGNKLRDEEPSNYSKIEKMEMDLLSESAYRLHNSYLSFLRNAQKHKKGTKVRLAKILRYAYYYGNYAHSCFIAGGKEDRAKKILKYFWKSYLNEIVQYRESLEEHQIQWVLQLTKRSRDIGIELDDQQISKLEAEIRQEPNPILLEQSVNQLSRAEDSLNREETVTALVLVDQSLELFLKDMCMRLGCEDDTHDDKGKPFNRWGFVEYLSFLDRMGEITENEKKELLQFSRMAELRSA